MTDFRVFATGFSAKWPSVTWFFAANIQKEKKAEVFFKSNSIFCFGIKRCFTGFK
jgi:hypothetical protein